jgi:hypothetical protein
MRVIFDDQPDDRPPLKWQLLLPGFGPGADCVLTQRPLFEGGMDRSQRASKPVDGPGLFEELEGECQPPGPA